MKEKLRKEIGLEKKKYSTQEKEELSFLIFSQLELLPEFRNAEKILLYYSLPDEVCTHAFIEKWKDKKDIFLPIVNGDTLALGKFCSLESCRKGAYEITEPGIKSDMDASEIDLVVVPGVAFDKNGNRLGRGKGYYDKLLSGTDALKAGVCFDFQLRENVPVHAWDIPMDMIITEKRCIKKERSSSSH